jgi:hypothetical protein
MLIEGAPKPKGNIRNPGHFAPGGPKWGMENAFFNVVAPMGKKRNRASWNFEIMKNTRAKNEYMC